MFPPRWTMFRPQPPGSKTFPLKEVISPDVWRRGVLEAWKVSGKSWQRRT